MSISWLVVRFTATSQETASPWNRKLPDGIETLTMPTLRPAALLNSDDMLIDEAYKPKIDACKPS